MTLLKSPRRDAGITLVEMLVSMVILGIVLAVVTGLFISVAQTVAKAQAINDSTRIASNAANELGRVIGMGTSLAATGSPIPTSAFQFAGREDLIFYSNVDVDISVSVASRPARPTMVRFSIIPTSRQLREDRWTATAAGRFWTFASPATAPNSTRTLGGPVVAPVGAEKPIFTYFDEQSVEIPVPISGSLAAADLKRISSVLVTVRIASAGGNLPVTIANTIVLPNL